MKLWSKTSVIKWLRIIHRDLGYLMVGVSLIYAISGIILNHMKGKDPAFRTEEKTIQLEPQLDPEELAVRWKDQGNLPHVKKILSIDEDHARLMLEGGVGVYNSKTGLADYEKHTQRKFVYWINRLHYNKIGGWSYMADFFAASLIFFAVSGLFLVRGKNGIAGRGKWFLLAGLAIPVVYIILS